MDNNYHDRFLLYLESTHTFKEDGRNKLIEFAEEQIPAFLHSNGYPDFGDLYSNLDSSFWSEVVTDGLPSTTDEEREYAHMVMESIKYIKGFIKFDKTANYKKLLDDKLKKEKARATQQSLSGNATHADHTQPEAQDQPRKEGEPTQVCVTHYERNPEDRMKALKRENYEGHVCLMRSGETWITLCCV